MNTTIKPKSAERSSFFTALCILTFTGSGLGFFLYFFAALFFKQASEFIIKYSNWSSVEAISPVYFTALMALMAISLTGAIRMWKFHRDGFFLYIFAQLCVLFLPVIWIDWKSFSDTNAIFTGIFIIGYVLNFKRLK